MIREEAEDLFPQDSWRVMSLAEALSKYDSKELVDMLNKAMLTARAYRREVVELSDLLTSLSETLPEPTLH